MSRSQVGDLFYRSLGAWMYLMSYGWTMRFGDAPPLLPDNEHVAPPGIREFLESAAGRFADALLNNPMGKWESDGIVDTLTRLERQFAVGPKPLVVAVLDNQPPIAATKYERAFPAGLMPYEDFLEGTRDETLADEFYSRT